MRTEFWEVMPNGAKSLRNSYWLLRIAQCFPRILLAPRFRSIPHAKLKFSYACHCIHYFPLTSLKYSATSIGVTGP